MNLSQLSMRYRPVVLTLVGLLTTWGLYTFFTMSRREDPEFTIRTCVVATAWPGTPATKVEELVTDKLEEVLESIEEVDYINCLAAAHALTGDFESAIKWQEIAIRKSTDDSEIADMTEYLRSYEANAPCFMKPPGWRQRWA